jgi:hypothetical protein
LLVGEHPYDWAVLYFRQHLVAAHYEREICEVTIYNTAAANFLGMEDGVSLLPLYTRQWNKLSTRLWPHRQNVRVIHLGVQGANDCGIWTWLLPKIYNNSTFQTLCDVSTTKRKSRGRSKQKGLDDFFHQEVLSVLEKYVSAVPADASELTELNGTKNGTKEAGEATEKDKHRPTKKTKKRTRKPLYEMNQMVCAKWRRGATWYNGQIVAINMKKVVYDVKYDDDGALEQGILEKFIKLRKTTVARVGGPRRI